MSKQVEFYFDLGSPASYLAYRMLPQLAKETGAEVLYRPMLLGAVFKAVGNSSPATWPAKGQYLFKDLSRYARKYQVPFKMNPYFFINTLTHMRIAAGLVARHSDQLLPYLDAAYDAIWKDAVNMNDPAEVKRILDEAGLDGAGFLALAEDATVKEDLKQRTEVAVKRGIFGAPTFFVGDEMFWGQDRLDWVKEMLKAS